MIAHQEKRNNMKIHLICPVRNVTEEQQKEIDDYAKSLEAEGHTVHNPKYAVDQDDATGMGICAGHLNSMLDANRVDIFWDVNSKGSHFDLGMAFALHKAIKLVKIYQPDNEGKSYVKVMQCIERVSDEFAARLVKNEKLIEILKEEKLNAVKTQNWEKATEFRLKEKDLIDSIETAKTHFNLK